MKPYQVDRALMHLKQAGKFRAVAGIILGDFPECDAPAGSESVRDVAQRILAPLGVPVVWGAAVGHTARPMLTLPLGVRARLEQPTPERLEILEPPVRYDALAENNLRLPSLFVFNRARLLQRGVLPF